MPSPYNAAQTRQRSSTEDAGSLIRGNDCPTSVSRVMNGRSECWKHYVIVLYPVPPFPSFNHCSMVASLRRQKTLDQNRPCVDLLRALLNPILRDSSLTGSSPGSSPWLWNVRKGTHRVRTYSQRTPCTVVMSASRLPSPSNLPRRADDLVALARSERVVRRS